MDLDGMGEGVTIEGRELLAGNKARWSTGASEMSSPCSMAPVASNSSWLMVLEVRYEDGVQFFEISKSC